MKTRKRKKELDVDFIGSQDPLTKEEEKKLKEYFVKNKRSEAKIRKKETA